MQPAPGGVGAVWAQARSAAGPVLAVAGPGGGADGGGPGTVPWHVPEDLARFAALTRGHGVVLGRRTWDALPPAARPLPGRRCVVLTRDRTWSAAGAVVAHDPAAALAAARAVVPGDATADGRVWVAGGAQAHRALWAHLDLLDVTDVDLDVHLGAGATSVPAPAPGAGWEPAERWPARGWATSRTGLRWRTTRWGRAAEAVGGAG